MYTCFPRFSWLQKLYSTRMFGLQSSLLESSFTDSAFQNWAKTEPHSILLLHCSVVDELGNLHFVTKSLVANAQNSSTSSIITHHETLRRKLQNQKTITGEVEALNTRTGVNLFTSRLPGKSQWYVCLKINNTLRIVKCYATITFKYPKSSFQPTLYHETTKRQNTAHSPKTMTW